MDSWKDFLADYFTFTNKERWAILVLLLVITAVFLAPGILTSPEQEIIVADSLVAGLVKKADSVNIVSATKNLSFTRDKKRDHDRDYSHLGSERFYFDPNTIGPMDWKRLGVREKTVITIMKYLEKGGRFRIPDDLDRIYGLPPALVKEIKPFVRIEQKDNSGFKRFTPESRSLIRKNLERVLINQADSSAWEALPGIGAKLTSRILLFRSRLGGFYELSQVSEVYGLQDSVFQNILPFLILDEHPLKTVSINSASSEELASHPYIRKAIAQAIVQYRTTHGPFRQLEQLNQIHLINAALYEKLKRYCKLD